MRPVAVLAAVLSSLLLVPVAAAAPITGGQVDWGVKQSFRNYVTSPIATGTITTSEGASQNPPAGLPGTGNGGGPFRFPVTAGDEESAQAVGAGTRGKVRFSGHAGALDFTIFNVRVVLGGAGGSCVLADADTRRLNGGGAQESYRDVRFAELDTTGIAPVGAGANTTWANIPAKLTAEGSPAFAGFYDPGTQLDPVTLTYAKGAGQGVSAGSCAKSGSVVTVPPGAKPPASKTVVRPAVKLLTPTAGQRKLLARGKSVKTKVRVNTAGRVTLSSKGRIASRTRTASRVTRRVSKAGVVALRWKLSKSARRELERRGRLKLRLTAALPGAKPVDRVFTLRR